MLNSYEVVGSIVKVEVPHRKTGEVFTFVIDAEDFPLVDGKNSWSMDKNKTSAVANYRKDKKMCKITMHKLISGYKNTNFADGNRFNLRKENLVESSYRKRIRRCGVNVRGNSFGIFEDRIEIYLKNNCTDSVALIDIEDKDKALSYTWNVNGKTGYVQTKTPEGRDKSKHIYLHRLLLGDKCKGMYVDHISGNRLDNRRKNLRVCTNSENLHNNPRANKSNKSTGIRGVSHQADGAYIAQMKINGLHLRRRCHSLEEAYEQRKKWEREHLGDILKQVEN